MATEAKRSIATISNLYWRAASVVAKLQTSGTERHPCPVCRASDSSRPHLHSVSSSAACRARESQRSVFRGARRMRVTGRPTTARWPAIVSHRLPRSIARNVSGLKQICAYTLPEVTSLQTGPIVIGGTMYFTTDTISYAIDASSCAEKWKQRAAQPHTECAGREPRLRVHGWTIVPRHIRLPRPRDGPGGRSRVVGSRPSTRRVMG